MKEPKSFANRLANNLWEPLLSVKGLLNLIKIDPDRKNKDEYFKLLEISVEKMSQSVQDLLSRSGETKSNIFLEEIDLKRVVEDAVESLFFMRGIERITFMLSIDNVVFYSDYKSLHNIFSNLISNAIRYRDPGKTSYLKIRSFTNNEDVEVIFEDNGVGIEESTYEEIAKNLRAKDHNGLESGLYQVKHLVGRLNGGIDVQSQAGVGSIFTVQIPKLFELE